MFSCRCGFTFRRVIYPLHCKCGQVYYKDAHGAAGAFVSPGTQAWDKLHAYPVEVEDWEPEAAARWYEAWVANDVPRNCDCRRKWRQLTERWQPDFSSREANFAWGVERHNDVNQALRQPRPVITLDEARIVHGWPQPPVSAFVAVTSLSALPQHQERQPRCLTSWRRFGLTVWAVNTAAEIEQLSGLYPQVERWIASDDQGTGYSFPTQRINALCAVADRPFLLINSDIELRGDQRRLLDTLAAGRVGVGIRQNYTGYWRNCQREGWGIDAFLMTPAQAATLPQLPFAIGRPMWDYWLPYHFDTIGQSMEWIGEPYFYHAAHAVHWGRADLEKGRQWIGQHYGRRENWQTLRSRWPFAADMPTACRLRG